MKAYTQQVLSAPARIPVMLKNKRGKDTKTIMTYMTKSGKVKNKYIDNPVASRQVGVIKHKATQNHDVASK